VDRIAKGKARVRHEFGTKVSVATTPAGGFVAGLRVSCTRIPWTSICPTGDRHGEVQHERKR
jgi:hypothetical protein